MRNVCTIEGCGRPSANSRGWCSKHYQRWRHHGDPLWERPRATRLELFAAKVEVDERGCWLWVGAIGSVGYGKFKLHKVMDAHRASWMLHRGDIPEGAFVLHKCDVKRCVNPAHLFLGTHADNMADKVAKNRQGKGEAIAGAVLTASDVRAIRELASSGLPYPQIAQRYGTTVSNVSIIVSRKTWKHVA